MKEMDPLDVLHSLDSEECPACGRSKRSRNSFCGNCYNRLPYGLRRNLYTPVGEGYEEVFHQALENLEQVGVVKVNGSRVDSSDPNRDVVRRDSGEDQPESAGVGPA